jgi:hypothetical protein
MALFHEHIGPKISAKIKIYILSRAKLLCSLCHEIPCIQIVVKNSPNFVDLSVIRGRYYEYKKVISIVYTVLRNITHSKEFSRNQGKHQNFNPSILPYKFGLILMGMKKKKKKILKKKFKMAWSEVHWCGSMYMAMRLFHSSSKTG